jgi:hypothetical protein
MVFTGGDGRVRFEGEDVGEGEGGSSFFFGY